MDRMGRGRRLRASAPVQQMVRNQAQRFIGVCDCRSFRLPVEHEKRLYPLYLFRRQFSPALGFIWWCFGERRKHEAMGTGWETDSSIQRAGPCFSRFWLNKNSAMNKPSLGSI